MYTVRQARRLREYTQRQMAAKLDVCVDTYRDIERHPEHASVSQARKICDILGFSVEEIFFSGGST